MKSGAFSWWKARYFPRERADESKFFSNFTRHANENVCCFVSAGFVHVQTLWPPRFNYYAVCQCCVYSLLCCPHVALKKSVRALLNCGANLLEYRQGVTLSSVSCDWHPLWAYRTYCCSSVSPATWRRCLTGMLLIAALAHTSFYHQDFPHCGCQNATEMVEKYHENTKQSKFFSFRHESPSCHKALN